MLIGEIIYSQRKRLGLTLEEVGNAVGVSKSTVKKWETGYIANIKRDKIANLARVLQINPVVLITGIEESADSDLYSISNIIPLPTMKKIPLVGTIACGEPILADENIEAFINMPEEVGATFALRCKGDSMINARIFDGDIVYIRQQPDVENGEIAAVLIGDEATLKKVYKYPNRLELRAENPTMKPMEYEGAEIDNVRILGKAVYFISKVQ